MIHPDIIPDLIEGANVYLSGEAEYTDAPSHLPENVKQFNIGRAHFYAYL